MLWLNPRATEGCGGGNAGRWGPEKLEELISLLLLNAGGGGGGGAGQFPWFAGGGVMLTAWSLRLDPLVHGEGGPL